MCFIASIRKIGKEPNEDAEKAIKSMLLYKATANPDGFALVDTKEVLRTLNIREAIQKVREHDLELLLTHFRIATTGAVTLDNVHWYEIGDYNFVHNGTIWQYSSYGTTAKEEEKTDSLQFFENLVKKLKKLEDPKEIAEVINTVYNEDRMNGRAMLYHRPTDRMYLIGDWHITVLDETYLIITSVSVDLDKSIEYKNYGGFLFPEEVNYIIDTQTKTIDDIGYIENYSTSENKYRFLKALNKINYNFNKKEEDVDLSMINQEEEDSIFPRSVRKVFGN